MAFSWDGLTLAFASNDQTVIFWNLPQVLDQSQLLRPGCDWVDNYLQHYPQGSDSDRVLSSVRQTFKSYSNYFAPVVVPNSYFYL
ncbi:hypothetical protein H4N54_07360 [Limnospira fusiformis KN01]|uniref:Uncharacterized protein n=1 Tax=Limnospira fusiformis PMC 851.14 TaxID=2219512 RepID=A0ABU9EI62_LIMFS|nr:MULTISPECIES: hypothetical protein [Limnospira]MDY7053479.1 hypothetical protein [Limnospira fusiformis LS22]MDT9187606.1 hypothetical protein [Limnospira sp. PMC 894.15]MDT9198531.1 hypothetical protein [Limnospira sp. PMC 1042.18]MDT9234963.1 hypothetical protein [Limnospira sp. PMC 917.15]ULB47142.1 hypothetical protein H4N54_07360 [Limnospira fusiformis KN01]